MRVRVFTVTLALFLGSAPVGLGKSGYLLDSRFHVISQGSPAGSFVLLGEDQLLSLSSDSGGTVRVSRDDGKTWSHLATMYDGPGPGRPTGIASIPNVETALALMTRKGVIIWIYRDWENGSWSWDDEKGEATEARRDVWSIRSLDGGRTWVSRQRVFEGYCGALVDIIQTEKEQVVVPIQRYLPNPGRHATCTYVSEDDGKTWKRSNIIDFGDQGHHAGAYEGTLVELAGNRLYMLLRTNLDRFWEAFSADNGYSWRELRPSSIDASSAPGYLRRLASGRLVLVWNRLPRARWSTEDTPGRGLCIPPAGIGRSCPSPSPRTRGRAGRSRTSSRGENESAIPRSGSADRERFGSAMWPARTGPSTWSAPGKPTWWAGAGWRASTSSLRGKGQDLQ